MRPPASGVPSSAASSGATSIFDKGNIKVERAIVDAAGHTSEKTTKTNQSRIVPLDRGTLALLREHRGIGPIIAWTPRALSQHLADVCDELGIERTAGRRKRLGWHAFRHYVGTAIANTGDIKAAARRLGHSRTSTTLDMYVHGDEDRDRAAADVMGSSTRLIAPAAPRTLGWRRRVPAPAARP